MLINSFRFSIVATEFEMWIKRTRTLVSKVSFDFMCPTVRHNVLELCLVRFETFSYRNITDKDTMFVAICKAKIIVFRGATAFANACSNARIFGRCCYLMPAYFLRKVPIETNVTNYEPICLTETECHLLAIWKIARA